LPSETMIWQPEFTDKILSRKPGAVHSLSARLYRNQIGYKFAQRLLGHKSDSMAAHYRDSREREWDKIEIG
ncbi:tyrosine-type recombinase/integrase, partial [Escherichia coli]|uniref:tyrosine-type recombinase/integrase n=1 Tax=Escherichia coli TaxID=562 RepID=UPI0038CC1988